MILKGYVNVDERPLPGVDQVGDLLKLDYPASSIEQIIWFHAIEHFTFDETVELVRKFYRWLSPGGSLIIEGPDVVKCVKNATSDFDAVQGLFGSLFQCRKGRDGYQHKWGWTGSLVQQQLATEGFIIAPVKEGISHKKPWRDYRVEARKP